MTAEIIDGAAIAATLRSKIAHEIKSLIDQGHRPPKLTVILVGEDPASQIYVANKQKACATVGIESQTIKLPASTSQKDLNQIIRTLSDDKTVDGILLQLPLPKHLKREEALDLIAPQKDVDGLTPTNQGLLAWNRAQLVPCTPLGVLHLIQSTGIDVSGKLACVVGKSLLVGWPSGVLLNNAEATVVTLHSKSKNKPQLARQADILVVAAGVRGLVTRDWVKPGAVVIDVGIHRHEGRIMGDVAFDEVKDVASHITPVPKGVGPMTIVMLLRNCLKAYRTS